ncbi:MAG: DNA translocase FtsK 4TM domain-containing protein, partial [Pseudonocardia sp.]|nr:DNA translocase FtsK 4TM domain-containing protein [Pseudonocardia sp.]
MAGRTMTGSTARASSPRRPAARRPRARKAPPRRDLLDKGIDATGRGMARLGRAAGRAVGRTREIDPAHRRDGLGVALLVLAVVTAAGVWWGAGGPVGLWLSGAIGAVIGLGAVVLPVILLVAGVMLVATQPRPDSRPRVAVGGLLLALGGLGLVHLVAGAPTEPALWSTGGGAVGYLAATPLATGLTAWVAAPVLVLLTGYAFLVLTATPVRAVPDRIRRLLGRGAEPE